MADQEELVALMRAALEVGLEMRKRQKQYFKTRDRLVLIDSKRLEVAFDYRLAELGYK